MKNFLKSQIKFSIFEITLAGLFVALNIISEKFINIKIPGLMSIGITYVWYIMMGLTMKPILAIISYMISDVINTATSAYGFAGYMWEYPLMYIGLIIIVYLMKNIYKIQKDKNFLLMVTFVNIATFITTLVFLIVKSDFQFIRKNIHSTDLTSQIAQILIWTFISLVFISFIALMFLYLKKRNEKLKLTLFIFTIVSLVVVIFNWIFEPIVFIKMMGLRSGTSYNDLYTTYLTARIAKSPILFILYPAIIVPLFMVERKINVNEKNKW